MSSHVRLRRSGFTIVELLIATLIFSMVTLIVTYGVISFSRQYIRGVNASKTQNAARLVLEDITAAIQLNGGAVTSPIQPSDVHGTNGSQGFCIGDKRYSYALGWQLVDVTPDLAINQTRHALVRDQAGNCGNATAQDVRNATLVTGSTELLSPGMRVNKLSVERIGTSDMFRVSLRLLYGENELIYSPSGNALGARAPDAACQTGTSGSQYCAVAELSTVVSKRIGQ